MGIATLPEWAFDARRDQGLARMEARHLFRPAISSLWLQRHQYLRGYAYEFIRMLSEVWQQARVQQALAGREPPDESLAVDVQPLFGD